jgi:HlyD family secretion protein
LAKVRLIGVGAVVGILLLVYIVYRVEHRHEPLTFYGNVDIREVTLGFRVPGRLEKMLFEEGDFVSPGQVMAQLEQDTFDEDLALANAQLVEAEAAYDNAKQVNERRTRLIKTGAVSQALFDQAVAMNTQTQAQVKAAQVQIEKAKTALSDTYIKAPTSGYILTRVREPGSIIGTGQTVYTLTVSDPVWVRAFIDEPKLGLIYPGQKVEVYTDTEPKKPYHGHIGYIASKAEFTPKNVETTQLRTDLVYRFRIVVDNPDKHLRQGMPVTVKIPLHQVKGNG